MEINMENLIEIFVFIGYGIVILNLVCELCHHDRV
jgi:hypothetical protein